MLRSNLLLIGLGITLHLAFLYSLSNDWLRPLFYDSSHTPRGFDFKLFYAAGEAVSNGTSIYDVKGAFGYRYLPLFAFSFGQIYAKFSFLTAYLIHIAISELFLLVNIYLTSCWTTNLTIRARAIFMWLGFSPFFLELYMGQVSFWACSILFFMLGSLRNKNSFRTGTLWSIAILIKPNTLLLAPVFLFLKRWYILFGSIFSICIISAPFFYLDSGSISHFLQTNLSPTQFKGALTHAGNIGLMGLIVSMSAKISNLPLSGLSHIKQLPLWSSVLIYSIPIFVCIINFFAAKYSFSKRPELHVSLWITTFFLIYKDVWEHHYVFILPIIIFLYIYYEEKYLIFIYIVLALPTPFILFDVESGIYGPIDPERSWTILQSIIHRSTKLIPTLVLWLWIIKRMFIQK
ncbi:MAG: glycosyltransferase family 87 protein [Candidatus Latescibacterota bacterium]|nr:glycosyltransferase family 87 protein [Candidatus Latescibacterota bacterium]